MIVFDRNETERNGEFSLGVVTMYFGTHLNSSINVAQASIAAGTQVNQVKPAEGVIYGTYTR